MGNDGMSISAVGNDLKPWAICIVIICLIGTIWYLKHGAQKKKKKKKKKKKGKDENKTEPVEKEDTDDKEDWDDENSPDSAFIRYWINDSNGEATIEYENGEQIEASFIKKKKKDALDCYFYTSGASHESILSPLWVAKDTESEDWFLFYERFTPFTQICNQMTETELYTSARNLLKALKYMYESRLVHKHMDNLDNYVVHKGMVKLINIHAKCRMGDDGWCQDLIGLTESFDVILPQTRLDERRCFINFLIDTSNMPGNRYIKRLQKAITYPYLCESKRRVKYFSDLHMAITGYVSQGPTVLQSDKFINYMNWEKKWRDGIVERCYRTWMYNRNQNKKQFKDLSWDYDHNKVWGLLTFLRNLYAHCLGNDQDVTAADDYATEKHPEFICHLHETYNIDR